MSGADFKVTQRELYGAGEYFALSRVLEPAAVALVEAAAVGAGDGVLDVAAGDGSVALAAARRGARVIAADISPAQVRRGEERCFREGVEVEWHVADAEQLPFSDGIFDRVLSSFGVVFAPHPEAAVAELFRVCRPGRIVGLTVWPQGSYMAELTTALRQAVAAEAAFPDPELGWGDEDLIRSRLRSHALDVAVRRRLWRGILLSVAPLEGRIVRPPTSPRGSRRRRWRNSWPRARRWSAGSRGVTDVFTPSSWS